MGDYVESGTFWGRRDSPGPSRSEGEIRNRVHMMLVWGKAGSRRRTHQAHFFEDDGAVALQSPSILHLSVCAMFCVFMYKAGS